MLNICMLFPTAAETFSKGHEGLACMAWVIPRGRATLHTDVLLKCSEKVDTQKGGPDCNTSNFVSFRPFQWTFIHWGGVKVGTKWRKYVQTCVLM